MAAPEAAYGRVGEGVAWSEAPVGAAPAGRHHARLAAPHNESVGDGPGLHLSTGARLLVRAAPLVRPGRQGLAQRPTDEKQPGRQGCRKCCRCRRRRCTGPVPATARQSPNSRSTTSLFASGQARPTLRSPVNSPAVPGGGLGPLRLTRLRGWPKQPRGRASVTRQAATLQLPLCVAK